MDAMKTHGAPSWSELITSDPAKASEFYSKLFGWKIQESGPEMHGYRTAQIGENGVAGIMQVPPDAQGMPSRWGVYVTVADLEKTLAEAKAMGAKICMEPMDVAGIGRMAVFDDPQGATLSIIQYLPQG